jgi:hypothetical protein
MDPRYHYICRYFSLSMSYYSRVVINSVIVPYLGNIVIVILQDCYKE